MHAPEFWVSLGLSPDLPVLFCERRPLARPAPAVQKAQWLPREVDSGGSFQLTFIHDTPNPGPEDWGPEGGF